MAQSDFSESTAFCDAAHPAILALARRLTEDASSDKDRAVRIFYWVRDRIEYRLGLHAHRASETLDRGYGSCSNKANLFVALARAAGLEASFRVLHVKTRLYFGPLCFDEFHEHLSERSLHVLPAVHLDGRWIQCDPSDDMQLVRGTAHLNPQSKAVEFDGESDALLKLDPDHIVLDEGRQRPDIDAILTKTRRRSDRFLELLRRYLDFLRSEGNRHASVRSVRDAFLTHLRSTCPGDYHLLVAAQAAA